MLDGREERDQTMSPGPDFSELCFLCVVSVVEIDPLGWQGGCNSPIIHFLGSSLQVQWKRKYASYLVVLAKVFIIPHWLTSGSYHPGPAIGQWVYNALINEETNHITHKLD